MYFITQLKHTIETDQYNNAVTVKSTREEAFKFFYGIMYSYGYSDQYDYVACYIMDEDLRCLKSEVEDRRPVPEPEIPVIVTEPDEGGEGE